jgi:hypothetical protein
MNDPFVSGHDPANKVFCFAGSFQKFPASYKVLFSILPFRLCTRARLRHAPQLQYMGVLSFEGPAFMFGL